MPKLSSPLPGPANTSGVGLNVPEAHTFVYDGEDVFGTQMKATLKVGLPASESGSLELLYDVGLFRHEELPDPPWEMPEFLELVPIDPPPPLRGTDGLTVDRLQELLAERLSELTGNDRRAARIAGDLATALVDGQTRIDRESAKQILQMIDR